MSISQVSLGLKTDPINTRYSYEWLFDLLAEEKIRFVQLGSFFELYHLETDFFHEVRGAAEERGLRIKSVFTAHRELGGFFVGDPRWERAARRNYEKLIAVAQAVGADYCGSNPGAVPRDRLASKTAGIACYLAHMRELMAVGRGAGLKGLTVEPMSCLAEPPSTPEEIEQMLGALEAWHRSHRETTVPVYLCGDISHGVADDSGRVIHTNEDLFRMQIPRMAEFHFKNTDPLFHSTFGFDPDEEKRGIVDLRALRDLCLARAGRWPVEEVVGYLEISGPKVGRDYSDPQLGAVLRSSLRRLREVFEKEAALATESIR